MTYIRSWLLMYTSSKLVSASSTSFVIASSSDTQTHYMLLLMFCRLVHKLWCILSSCLYCCLYQTPGSLVHELWLHVCAIFSSETVCGWHCTMIQQILEYACKKWKWWKIFVEIPYKLMCMRSRTNISHILIFA